MRRIIKIMKDWSFTYHNGEIIKLDLLHTWNAIDGQDGGNDYWRGTCSYKKIFEKPEFDAKKELVYLQFHGVNASAKVILNGKEVLSHLCGK